MRHCIVLLTGLVGLICCSSENDNQFFSMHTLLTSTKWVLPLENKDENHLEGIWSFNTDGTYIEEFGTEYGSDNAFKMTGSWKWVSENEISLLYCAMITDGEKLELGDDYGDRFIVKIMEVSDQKLKVVKKHTGDSENSMITAVTLIPTRK